MKKVLFMLSFMPLIALAKPPQQWVTWPMNGITYLDKSACPGACYPIVQNDKVVDAEIAELVGGKLVESAAKKQERATQENARKTAKSARIALRAQLRVFRDQSEPLTAAQMSDAIKALLKLQNLEAE